MDSISEFLNNYFLWKDAMIVGALSGATCGFLGVYVVLRRIIFVSAALTQVSSLGVALAFYFQGITLGLYASFISPFVLSLILTIVAAVFLALKVDFLRISQEGVIGFAFLIASAGVVIVGDNITKGAHEIADILFGSAVIVEPNDVYIISVVAFFIIIINRKFFKDFIFVSFDSETAKLFKYPVRLLNSLLLITIGIVIAVATRAIGALPVFGLLALPPLSSLLLTERLNFVFMYSIVFGVLSASLGYFSSYILSIPTGASITFIASIIFTICFLFNRFKISM